MSVKLTKNDVDYLIEKNHPNVTIEVLGRTPKLSYNLRYYSCPTEPALAKVNVPWECTIKELDDALTRLYNDATDMLTENIINSPN